MSKHKKFSIDTIINRTDEIMKRVNDKLLAVCIEKSLNDMAESLALGKITLEDLIEMYHQFLQSQRVMKYIHSFYIEDIKPMTWKDAYPIRWKRHLAYIARFLIWMKLIEPSSPKLKWYHFVLPFVVDSKIFFPEFGDADYDLEYAIHYLKENAEITHRATFLYPTEKIPVRFMPVGMKESIKLEVRISRFCGSGDI